MNNARERELLQTAVTENVEFSSQILKLLYFISEASFCGTVKWITC